MAYVVQGAIEASDYNNFYVAVRQIFTDDYPGAVTPDNYVDLGYGYFPGFNLSTVAIADTVTADDWAALISTINTIGTHQGTSTKPPMPVTNPGAGDPIVVYNSPTTFDYLLSSLRSSRLNVAAGQQSLVNGPTFTNNALWSDSLDYEYSVDFGSWDNLRYFFNTGGYLSLTSTYNPGGSTSAIEQDIINLMAKMSPLKLYAHHITNTTGANQSPNGTSFGALDLYSTAPDYTTLYLQSFSGGAFVDRGIRVSAKLRDTGVSGIIDFKITILDPDGDPKDGTTSHAIKYAKSVGVIPYTGPVTVTGGAWTPVYTPEPFVTSVVPANGTTAGGTNIKIYGINFLDATEVTIGGIPILSFTVVSTEQITCKTPANVDGTIAPIVVTTPIGVSNNDVTYEYIIPSNTPISATGGSIMDVMIGYKCYRVHTFTSSGTFTVTSPGSYGGTIEYLLVGGGGGGGNTAGTIYAAGGGGAGGLVQTTGIVRTQPYPVVIGAGGAAGENGGNTSFMTSVAVGGGRGGWWDTSVARSGGSGGGAGQREQLGNQDNPSSKVTAGAAGTPGQGNVGGSVIFSPGAVATGGGGGGGFGGPGGNTTPIAVSQPYPAPYNTYTAYVSGGAGGLGQVNFIRGAAYGLVLAAGGGGAGCNGSPNNKPLGWPTPVNSADGAPGAGGGAWAGATFYTVGGIGARYYPSGAAGNGVNATGSGGGGGQAYYAATGSQGGTGGTGIAVIRYQKCPVADYNFDATPVGRRAYPILVDSFSSAVTLDGRIMGIGGITSGQPFGDCYLYNPATNVWNGAASIPIGRYDNGAERLPDGRIYCWAGSAAKNAGNVISDGRVYTPGGVGAAGSWAGAAPYPIACHEMGTCVLKDGRIFSIGGRTSINYATVQNRAFIFNGSSWIEAARAPVAFTECEVATLADGRVILVVGYSTFFYDPSTNAWSAGPNCPGNMLRYQMVATDDGYAITYGGIYTPNMIYIYNACCNAWGVSTARLPVPSWEQQACIANDSSTVYMFGGVNSNTDSDTNALTVHYIK